MRRMHFNCTLSVPLRELHAATVESRLNGKHTRCKYMNEMNEPSRRVLFALSLTRIEVPTAAVAFEVAVVRGESPTTTTLAALSGSGTERSDVAFH